MASRRQDVFVNCPFDPDYREMFEALSFAVLHCGFRPRSALEAPNSGRQRYERLVELVRGCDLTIHDLSRTELGPPRNLPRFNMPFELGLCVGAREFGGGRQRRKDLLVLERRRGDSRLCCSDLSGTDPVAHGGSPSRAVGCVRHWLNGHSPGGVAGPLAIRRDYESFRTDLPALLASWRIEPREMTFADFQKAALEWLDVRREGVSPDSPGRD